MAIDAGGASGATNLAAGRHTVTILADVAVRTSDQRASVNALVGRAELACLAVSVTIAVGVCYYASAIRAGAARGTEHVGAWVHIHTLPIGALVANWALHRGALVYTLPIQAFLIIGALVIIAAFIFYYALACLADSARGAKDH